jgi:hypothetical protein
VSAALPPPEVTMQFMRIIAKVTEAPALPMSIWSATRILARAAVAAPAQAGPWRLLFCPDVLGVMRLSSSGALFRCQGDLAHPCRTMKTFAPRFARSMRPIRLRAK